MSIEKQNQVMETGTADPNWKFLYKISAMAALVMLALIPIQVIVYIIWQIPETALDSYTLFQGNKFIGLLALELPYIFSNILSVPIFLALYVALRRTNESVMAIATVFGLMSIVAVIVTRPTFDMLYLSDQYAAATTEAQRALLLAAGEAKLVQINGTAQQVSYVLGAVALLMVSVVMLKTDIFSKGTAYVGIIANVLLFGLYVPTIGIILSVISVFPFYAIWLILVARRFIQLGASRMDATLTMDTFPLMASPMRNESI